MIRNIIRQLIRGRASASNQQFVLMPRTTLHAKEVALPKSIPHVTAAFSSIAATSLKIKKQEASSSGTILLLDLDRAEVLLALYNNANYTALSGNGSLELAKKAIEKQSKFSDSDKYFDSVDLGAGKRLLKVDLSGITLDPCEYNQLYGATLAQNIINSMMREMLVKKFASPSPYKR